MLNANTSGARSFCRAYFMSIYAGWRRHWSMCSHLVHLAKPPVLTIDNMLLDLLRSLSFVLSWHMAAQLSYSPAQTKGHKIMDGNDISIYTPKELDRLESLWVREFIHTCVYDVDLLKKGEMDANLPTLFWLEFCDEISGKSTTSGGDLMDRAHDGGKGTRSGDVALLHRLIDWHRQ
jgi:hypothetical protein